MTVLDEGELRFTFGPAWEVEKFDAPGASWPKGVSPIDFIIEDDAEIVLLEVKEAVVPWRRKYISDCAVVAAVDIAKVLPGCFATRIPPRGSCLAVRGNRATGSAGKSHGEAV